jgi:hypothetical protein
MTYQISLPALTLARYQFTLLPEQEIHLPLHAGSTLRGGLGHAFKQMVCFQPQAKYCRPCPLHQQCPYAYIFATPVPANAEVLSKNSNAPVPLIIEPSPTGKQVFRPGEPIVFHVTLVGNAVDYLSYIVTAFRELGHVGLGAKQGHFRLAGVKAIAPLDSRTAAIYDAKEPDRVQMRALTADTGAVVAWADSWPSKRLTLTLRTPTRLKYHGRMMQYGPPFHVLVRRLLDRVSSLTYFHCGESWDLDFRDWIKHAKNVGIADAETKWESWSRYSGRQQQRVLMGGLTGKVTYAGDIAPFRALLALGTLVHVGKGTVFGNGQLAL